MNSIVFFVFDPSPRIERRIVDFVDAGFSVEVYGYRYNVENVSYCISSKYKYNVIEVVPHSVSYFHRISSLKKIIKIVNRYNRKTTLFYFFSLNVAAIAPFLHIKYVYEESDMLFDRFNNRSLRRMVAAFNKHVIKKSSVTVMTSEGFSHYYFGKQKQGNIEFVLNKVNVRCLLFPPIEKRQFDINNIRFGFAGNIRYQATLNLARVIAKNYPQHEFHFFGNVESLKHEDLESLKVYPNIYFHGLFKNPDDLPAIYSSIDFCVCNYDISGINPRYAEPNKLYESLFFDTPIMVSPNTFVGNKVEELGAGFEIDSYDESLINQAIDAITIDQYEVMIANIKSIPKSELVTDNRPLIERIRSIN